MTLELIKTEEGLMAGEVLYHALIKKTDTEIKQLKTRKATTLKLKLSRRRQQAENLRRKGKFVKSKDHSQVDADCESKSG